MYWEEIIELIKTHGDEPKSTFPNPYNDSDDYEVYRYERGTLKTSYLHINQFSKKIKNCLKKYLKYGINNIQIFASLGASEGMGTHEDDDDVLILCLEKIAQPKFLDLPPSAGGRCSANEKSPEEKSFFCFKSSKKLCLHSCSAMTSQSVEFMKSRCLLVKFR